MSAQIAELRLWQFLYTGPPFPCPRTFSFSSSEMTMLVVEEVVVLVLELVVEIILKNKVSGGDERGRETYEVERKRPHYPAIEAGDWAVSALELKPLGN